MDVISPLPVPTPHPLLPVPSTEEIAAIARRPDGAREWTEWYNKRERLIELSLSDPYHYGFELEPWKWVDDAIAAGLRELLTLGGNRAGKSEYWAKRAVQAAVRKDKAVVWCLHTTLPSSREMQQPLIWKYLPNEWKEAKSGAVTNVKYSLKNGFADEKLVGPNASMIIFKNYSQSPDVIEGGECDLIWADELVPVDWVRTLRYRLVTRGGILGISFTPIRGYTPTVQEYVTDAETEVHGPADFLPQDQVLMKGLPPGRLPLIQQPACRPRAKVFYFHSRFNVFNPYANLVSTAEGASDREKKQRLYGVAERSMDVAFPKFGDAHVVALEEIPRTGTNYHSIDPAGRRNYFMIWWRTTDGDPPRHYVYREWPDAQRYGPWAEPSANPERRDGDPGPAQLSAGYGIVEYKQAIMKAERIEGEGNGKDGRNGKNGNYKPQGEHIFRRVIDPRAGRNAQAAERGGGTCLIDLFFDEQRTADGKVDGPSMILEPASGVSLDEGISQINSLLTYDDQQPVIPILNEPRLFVAANCLQTRFALATWTGNDGDKGACKDPIDALRYIAMEDPVHVTEAMLRVRGGGSY